MFYTATVKIFSEDEKGRRKAKKESYLVQAESITEAEFLVKDDFRGTTLEFEVVQVGVSNIIDVINYVPDEKILTKKVENKKDEYDGVI